MKFGIRKPSLKKSLKARTAGKWKRQVKKQINPFYGKKGMGYIRDPKKALYNKVYNKTTVGVNPLTGIGTSSSSKKSPARQTADWDEIVYTKHRTVKKEVAVASPIERFFRKLTAKESLDTKTIEEQLVVEQATYGEVMTLQGRAEQGIKDYNQAMRYVEETTNPETLFTYLTQAEEALSQTVELSRNHSFLVAEGDDLEKTLAVFMQDKDALVKAFVNRHYDSCLESADELKTDEGKRNRYAKNYEELTHYFKQLPPALVACINHKWQDKIIRTKHLKEES
ncbi:hypothetical protein [Alkalibacterium sp. 20]|uniref:hypothetical protein n=1 Tax=Alkalibacterium sp. 20 TaxID=1798803 RepID=UPI000AC630BE|nr:hypothetical protein [Alkalibacterium sp. 20]